MRKKEKKVACEDAYHDHAVVASPSRISREVDDQVVLCAPRVDEGTQRDVGNEKFTGQPQSSHGRCFVFSKPADDGEAVFLINDVSAFKRNRLNVLIHAYRS